MDELESLRKKKLEELKRNYQEQAEQNAQAEQQIQQLESIVKQVLTREALERYSNLKTAFPEKAVQILVIIAQAIQSRHLTKVDDDTLKELLKKLESTKKEIKIRRAWNGTIQASKQEEKTGKTEQANQMGAFLDSSEDLWQIKKSPSR